ncbi:MAG: hypothetical protein M1839_006876 [Geoglossum umbratile]|nr:MAG: hypothetical protein M1839_006876 [Geoglossum umbratile]
MPIVLHAVPPEERAVGADGKQKPFAIVDRAPLIDGEEPLRFKRTPSGNRATGSFGRSRRQSSRTKSTPFRDDWNLTATDDMWKSYLTKKSEVHQQEQQRNATLTQSSSTSNLLTSGPPTTQPSSSSNGSSTATTTATTAPTIPTTASPDTPTEVLLHGFQPTRSYAAIDKFERIGGPICEDFPRTEFDTPSRDPSVLRNRPLTREELRKANALAMGNCWIKVTFESRYAADRAVRASPQEVYGHWVFAEIWTGIGLAEGEDREVPVIDRENPPPPLRRGGSFNTSSISTGVVARNQPTNPDTANKRIPSSTLPRSFTSGSLQPRPATSNQLTHRRTSSLTTPTTPPVQPTATTHPDLFCSRIPTVPRALRPAEEAVLPRPSWFSILLASLGVAALFGGLEECNRLEDGRFDWDRSSWYWRFWWCLEGVIGGNFTGTREDAEGEGEG